jgi:hypothetical protein
MCAAPPGAFKFTGFSTKSSDSKPEGKHRSGSILEPIMFQCCFCYVLLVAKAIWQHWHANIPEQRRKFILWQGRARYRVCVYLCVCVFCSRIEETHFQNGAG